LARVKVEQQAAYLLHRRPYSETSLLLDIFSRDHGRLTLIAKGCRKKKTQAQGLFLPFKPLLVSWTGRGELPILTSIEHQGFLPLPDKTGINCGYYVNELLLKLLHRHDSHEALFDRYNNFFYSLANGDDPNSVLRVFEKYLLQEIGFGLVLDHDVETGEIIHGHRDYQYIPQKGPVASSDAHIAKISGETLMALQTESFDSDKQKHEARSLTRALIDLQLNGKELRSRRVIREMKRLEKKIQFSS
jgi:DNA repair protein RecO (recombination protein O)